MKFAEGISLFNGGSRFSLKNYKIMHYPDRTC